jgi:5-methylcytosine-specific restriction endonuclease McrA
MIPIKVNNIDTIISEHADQILKDYKDYLDATAIDALLTPYSFREILVAKPDKLWKIIETLRERKKEEFNSVIKTYKEFAKWSESKYCAESLVKRLELTVCPYCNRSFIHSIKKRKSRTCQIDHFFNKNKYPYLALSFYNLIPVCYACNHTKSTHDLGLSPYEIDNSDTVTFSYAPTSTSSYQVELKVNDDRMNDNVNVLGLKGLYAFHDDYAEELVTKRMIYSDAYLKELEANFGDVVESKDKLLRLIAGNYIEVDDLKKRPLAKMTRDIMKQLKFIKE